MFKSTCKLVILSLLAALVSQPAGLVNGAAGLAPAPGQPHTGMQAPQATSAASWYDGLIQYSTITNCASIIFGSPYQEYGAGTYVGFYADPNNSQPAPNVTYYVHVVIYGLGNSCSGMRAYLDLALPANTSLAITGTNKVKCYYDGGAFLYPDCPQTLPASSYNPGAFQIPSTDSAHAYTWPIPQGHNLEFQIPVVSSAALSNSPMQANVWMLDGNSSPWLRPQEGVYVFNSGASTPTIIYPSPSTISVTATTAHSQAYLYTNLTGTGYFDLGTNTSYSLVHEPVSIPVAGTAWLVYDDWGLPLQPDTLYHWRFEFHDSNGHDTFGADQTFRTLPDGQVTVGDGTPGNCTTPNFEAALPTAKSIKFDCGALPITLTLSSPHPITSNLTIDGGNKVTLDAGGAGQHFDVQSGFALTLTAITVVKGISTSGCGGSIDVAANARLTLSQARLLNNQSSAQGGALCIETGGSASIADSLFRDNRSTNHGGAIGNYGALTISGTKFISNSSSLNGGAIDTTVFAAITGTTFLSNTSGWRGGGINNYLGLLKVTNTSFISNKTSGFYGGGLANDSNGTLVSGSTFFDNDTGGNGGAIESSGSLTLTNSTLSANRAQLNGGGIYWAPSAATTLTLLNDTVVSNTAGTPGGNISGGAVVTEPIKLKNTLVAFGSPNNCDHTLGTQGNNLENTNVCGFSAGSDVRNANPKLGPLQDNGGPTLTHALKPGSPAIDAGTNSGCPATDQRGSPRPQDGDSNGLAVCDIGAFEAAPGAAFFVLYLPLVRR